MTTELEQLKALAEAATQGPWVHEKLDPNDPLWGACEIRAADKDVWISTHVTSVKDARYIAAANPKCVSALIAENEKMIAACALYDKALLCIYPTGAGGPAWELWNSARKTLGEAK